MDDVDDGAVGRAGQQYTGSRGAVFAGRPWSVSRTAAV